MWSGSGISECGAGNLLVSSYKKKGDRKAAGYLQSAMSRRRREQLSLAMSGWSRVPSRISAY